jgi:hypothetical protein
MDDAEKAFKAMELRTLAKARLNGHAPGPFEDRLVHDASGKAIAARKAVCSRCNGGIWALASGEDSMPGPVCPGRDPLKP